jgi:hypothetical protein
MLGVIKKQVLTKRHTLAIISEFFVAALEIHNEYFAVFVKKKIFIKRM